MAQANVSTQAPPQSAGRSLRIVLFGMPDAGKSSLLGALAQAAQTQEHILNGSLVDKSQRLIELQRRLYEDRPRETLEEVAPFEVSLQPFSGGSGLINATLIDCDGRVANELLGQQDLLKNGRALTKAVLDADTLVLVVDASTEVAVLNRDFGQFAKFLRALERSRGQRTEIGGLPVYLVLTKCDLLAQKADTAITWMDRIEERKRKVDRLFKEFLAQQADREQMQFGKIDLHLWATAVKRPALGDTPAKPRDPYGVAELFRQCLASARIYQERRNQAARRLTVAVLGILGVVAAMVLLMLALFLSQPSQEANALNEEVRRYLSANDRSTDRLKNAAEKLKQLHKINENPDFSHLSREQQEQINAHLKELTAFQAYREKWQEISEEFSGDLNRVRDDAERELAAIKEKLKNLKIPPEYADSWAKVAEVKQQQQWLKDLDALDRERRFLIDEYEKLLTKAKPLVQKWLAEDLSKELLKQSRALMERARELPGSLEKSGVRRNADELVPSAADVHYSLLFRLQSFRQAFDAWNESRERKILEKHAG